VWALAMRWSGAVLVFCLAAAVLAAAGRKQGEMKPADGVIVRAVRAEQAVKIDGILDEPVWRRATPSCATGTSPRCEIVIAGLRPRTERQAA